MKAMGRNNIVVIPNQVARLRSLYRNPRFLAFVAKLGLATSLFSYTGDPKGSPDPTP